LIVVPRKPGCGRRDLQPTGRGGFETRPYWMGFVTGMTAEKVATLR
jgi:hypothetical protein